MKRAAPQPVLGPLLAFCLVVPCLAPLPAAAGPGLHIAAAIEHAELVGSHHVSPNAQHMLVHAHSALAHAREALHEKAIVSDRAANKLLHQAIRELRQAEMQARFGNAAKAKTHAATALAELRKIK